MGSGNCANCTKRMNDTDEAIACEACGRPICEHCIVSGLVYESPVDGAAYCHACVSDLPTTLARIARVKTEEGSREKPRLIVADLVRRDRMLDVYGDDYGSRPGEGGFGDYCSGEDDRFVREE